MSGYNPYENMLNTLDVAAEKLGYTRSEYEVLRHPERELKVAVPLQLDNGCLLYTSPSPRDPKTSRMPSSA